MEKYHIQPYDETTGKGLVRHIMIRYGFHTDQIMVCLILNGDKLPAEKALVESLCEIPGMTSITINVNKKRNNVILGNQLRLLWGKSYITDSIGNVSYQISPLSFFQVNPIQTEKLYGKALEYAGLPEMKLSGICTAESEPSLCSWHREQNLSAVWRSFHRPLTTQEKMRRSTELRMWNFCWKGRRSIAERI